MKAKEELIGDVIDGLLKKDEAIYEELFETLPPSLDEISGYPASATGENETLTEKYYINTAYQHSDSLMSLASKVDRDFHEIFRILQEKADSIPPLTLPIKDMSYVQVGASVGIKHNPVYNLQMPHEGLDLIAPQGSKVYAAAAGRVTKVTRSRKGLGNEVEIDHGNGYVTKYSLLGDISVTQGRTVSMGQVVGTVGVSTFISAPHLHFEVRYNEEIKDPIHFLFSSLTPEEYSRVQYMAAKTSQSMD
jgi:murein DD-endopeptidase MepM/ murein hydrolase activator NlpD